MEGAVELVREMLNGFGENMSVEEKVVYLITKKNLDQTRLRNALIIQDYDLLRRQNETTITEIYEALGERYSCGPDNIKYIIRQRRLNELG